MSRRPWTPPEITAVVHRYPAEGPRPIAADLGRTEDAVSGLARRFGVRTPRKSYHRPARNHATPPR